MPRRRVSINVWGNQSVSGFSGCPRCKKEMRLVAVVEDIEVIRRILEHLGLWLANTRPTPRAHSLPGLQPLPEDSYSQLPAAEEEDHSQLPARPLGLLNHPGRRTGLPLRAPVRLILADRRVFLLALRWAMGKVGWAMGSDQVMCLKFHKSIPVRSPIFSLES